MPATKNTPVRWNFKKAKAVNNTKTVLTDISKSATANKVTTKAPETVQDTKVICKMAIFENKVVKTVKNDSTVPLSPSSSGTAHPESSTSFTPTPCAGGQAALVPSDSGGLSNTPSDSDATISDAAKALRKQIEKSRSTAIFGAVNAPRNMKRLKKGRVPLTAAARKDHNVFKTASQECDQLLTTFAKQKRACCPASPDSSVWRNTNLFFIGLPDPVDNGESSTEDEDMFDIVDLVADPVSDDFEEIVEKLPMNAPDCPVETAKVTLASAHIEIHNPSPFTAEGDSEQRSEDSDTSEQVAPETSLIGESPLNFLFFPNQAEHVPVFTREEELWLIKLHVAPLVFPGSPKKPSRSETKAAKAEQVAITPPAVAGEETESPATEETIEQDPAVCGKSVNTTAEEFVVTDDVPIIAIEQDTSISRVISLPIPEITITKATPIKVVPVLASPKWLTLPSERIKAFRLAAILDVSDEPLDVEDIPAATEDTASVLVEVSEDPQRALCSSDEVTVPSRQPRGNSSSTSSYSGKGSSSSHRSEENFERELVIARNTFLGITSLEDFIVRLNCNASSKTTTKESICNAFATLAAEQLDTLTGLGPNFDVDRAATSLLEQRKIKLGKTTLFSFLSAIPFDDERVTNTHDIISAFKQAARVSDKPSEKVMMALRAASESSS
jgi:hypothetical protein